MNFLLEKCDKNPILSPKKGSWFEELGTLNPACIYEDGYFWLLYRAAAADDEHTISIGLAKSKDGVNFERCFDHPILAPDKNGLDCNGVEDPRVIKIDDMYYMTYASRPYPTGKWWLPKSERIEYSPTNLPNSAPNVLHNNNSMTFLAMSEDMIHWKKLGKITDSRHDDRDVFFFPEKINGQYVMISRSQNRIGNAYGCDKPSIWISYSDDLLEWNNYKLLCSPNEKWEGKKIGGSVPPIKTDKGWLFIYHGVENKEFGKYCVGAMLLDLDNPEIIIARTKEPIMTPEFDYETMGFYSGCVFPTSGVVVDGTLFVFYGSGDKYCCQATCKLEDLIDYLVKECKC